jgi:insulysin
MAWPVPQELVLTAPQLVWEWDAEGQAEKELTEVLQSLRVDKGRSVLMARACEFEKISANKDASWETEPWYGTSYQVEKLDHEFIQEAEAHNDLPELFLPGPNEFIPTNLEVDRKEVSSPLKRPHLIRETPLSSLWHKKDDRFWLPKASVIADIRSPLTNNNARNSVLTRLYSDIVNDSLSEFSYDASLAGLTYNFASHSLGVFVALGGYNDKLEVLMKDILLKVKGIVVNPERLKVMKEQCKRDWQNFFFGQSYTVSDYFGRYLLTKEQWTIDEKLKELDSITAEEVQNHVKNLLSEVQIRMLVVGNIYKDEAIKLCETTEKVLGSAPLAPPGPVTQALLLPEASNFIWKAPVPNPNEPNSALTYFMDVGRFTDQRLRVTAALLTQILSEPAFNVLRTQEQLGYIVGCSQWNLPGGNEIGIRVVVQSERGPEYLEKRVEAFLESMKGTIDEMDHKTFQEQKDGLERKWQEAPKNLTEEANRYWAYIDSGHLDFFRRDEDSALLKEITKADVLALFLSKIIPTSSTRAKLAIHLRSQKPRPQKVSIEAMQAFEEKVTAAALGFEKVAWRDHFSDEKPIVADFVKFWDDALTEGGVKPEIEQDLLATIPGLLKEYPLEEESDNTPREGAAYIEDLKAFKESLEVTEPAKALVDWGDLPVPKL